MPKPPQIRSFSEVRTDTESGGFDGYASTFWAIDSYGTAVAPGAFKRSLGQKRREDGTYKLPVLFQHNPDWHIGVPTVLKDEGKNGKGLYAQTRLFDDGGTVPGTGGVALRQLRQGAAYGLSIGFRTIKDRTATDDDPLTIATDDQFIKKLNRSEIRIIEEVDLWEFSVVTFEANQDAQITSVRSALMLEALQIALDELREGRLSPDHLALVKQFSAFQDAPGPSADEQTPTALDEQQRDISVDIEIALSLIQGYMEPQHEHQTR
jgi:uncharacterized protein